MKYSSMMSIVGYAMFIIGLILLLIGSVIKINSAKAQDRIVVDTSRSYQEVLEDAVNAILPCAKISVTQGRKSVWTAFKDSEESNKVYVDFDNSVTNGKPLVIECEKEVSLSPPDPPVVNPPTEPEDPPVQGLHSRTISWIAPTKREEGDEGQYPVIIVKYFLNINGSIFEVSGDQLFYQIALSPAQYVVNVYAQDTYGYSSKNASIEFTVP